MRRRQDVQKEGIFHGTAKGTKPAPTVESVKLVKSIKTTGKAKKPGKSTKVIEYESISDADLAAAYSPKRVEELNKIAAHFTR